MVDFLKAQQIDILLCVGGDGTLTGAHAIAQEIKRRGLPIAVVGIPKTIDNDIQYCYRTFGFVTAVEEAEMVIDCAHTEAKSVLGGVGLVKLMGREAGFIAAAATIASGEVNFTLVPEVPFELNGPQGLLGKLERRLDAREHAVIVVAEGAGQHLLTAHEQAYDKSGNRKLGDIGPFLKGKIIEHFARVGKPVGVKYFDPSYNIRSVKANAADSLYCEQLARQAVHAGMAGKTDLFVGLWHNHMVHVPLEIAVGQSRRLDPQREMWAAVLATTGQENW
jgi:6-phosphofructokinase 1